MLQTAVEKEIDEIRDQIAALQKKSTVLKQKWGAQEVSDYELTARDGSKVKLSAAFGDHDSMILVHNMGKECPYCTLWADGFKDLFRYIVNGVPGGDTKAAFLMVSPDTPEEQKAYAESRGWEFEMLSTKGTSLFEDLGYIVDGNIWPGFSVLKRQGDKITRIARDFFGPGDDYCSVFSFFRLLPGAPSG